MSDTATLTAALRILARDIHCEDGVATQCITDAADTIERLRLTDAEREAIKAGISACEDITYGGATDQEAADTMRRLLDRLK